MARLRLCSPSKPTNAKATMVSATSTSMSVNPSPPRAAPASRSTMRAEIQVARCHIGAPGESVGNVERVRLLSVVEMNDGGVDVAVRIEVRERLPFEELPAHQRHVDVRDLHGVG